MRITFFISVLIASLLCLVSVADAGIIGRPSNQLGLIGYWPMNEGSGTQAGDSSGNKVTGTFGTVGAHATWVPGRFGSAVRFNPTDGQYISMGDQNRMDGLTRITVSAWVRSTDNTQNTADEVHFVTKSDCSGIAGDGPFELAKPQFVTYADFTVYSSGTFFSASGGSSVGTPANVDDGQWHLITGTYDGSAVNVYVDGKLEKTQTIGSITLSSTAKVFQFSGCTGDGSFGWFGDIDDVRVYSRALTASQIAALYSQNGAAVAGVSARLDGALGRGLVGHWTFDGTDVTDKVYDKSGNANNGYFRGGATSSAKTVGKHGQALRFNGTTSYVNAGSDASLDDLDFITVSAWIKPNTDMSAAGEFFAKTADGGTFTDGPDMWYDPTDLDKLWFAQSFTGGFGFATWYASNAITRGQWQHVAIVYSRASAANNPTMYVNGIPQTVTVDLSAVGSARSDSAGDVVIGAYGTVNTAGFFKGLIDDVRVYNRMLSASEIKQLYNLGSQKINTSSAVSAGGSSLTTGLQGHWTFDGADVTDKVYDKSGNANNGYFAAVFGTAATSTAKVIGKLGQALRFDGNDTYVNVGTSTSLDITGAITISAWIRPSDFTECTSGCDIVSNYNSAGDTAQYEFYIQNNELKYGTSFGGGSAAATTNTPISQLNRWYHVVVTRNNAGGLRTSDTVVLYVDGVAQPAAFSTDAPPTTGFGRTAIGRDGDLVNSTYHFPGMIDDVRIYNRDLTSAEVKQLYNLGK